MKIIKFTALGLLLAIFFTVFVGCEDIITNFYRAEMDDYVNENIREEFARENRTSFYYYGNPEMENAPESLLFVINDKVTFDNIFLDPPFEVDFDKEEVYVYTFDAYNARELVIKNVHIVDDILKINISCKTLEENNLDSADCGPPYQRWIAVKIRKTNVTVVEFDLE